MAAEKSWYLKASPEDCAPSVVLVGDPARVQLFAEEMEAARIVAQEREFMTLSGKYKGLPVSVISVGIGAPAAIIVLEEIWELGARAVIRAGTGMGIDIPLGDYILPHGAVRYEGVSRSYLPLEFPAIADPDLFCAQRDVLKQEEVSYTTGLVATSDGFYTDMFHHGVPGLKPEREDLTFIDSIAELGVIGTDMETSALYTVASLLGIKAVSLLLATVNGRTQEMLEAPIRAKRERQLVKLVLNGLLAFEHSPPSK